MKRRQYTDGGNLLVKGGKEIEINAPVNAAPLSLVTQNGMQYKVSADGKKMTPVANRGVSPRGVRGGAGNGAGGMLMPGAVTLDA